MAKKPREMGGTLSAFGTYLQTHKIERDAVAKALEITPAYVSMLAHGKATPAFKLARQVAAWTRQTFAAPFTCDDWDL